MNVISEPVLDGAMENSAINITQSVTAKEAAQMLGIEYKHIHIVLRMNRVPFTCNRRQYYYNRPTVEALVGKLQGLPTSDEAFEGWLFTKQVAEKLASRCKTRVTTEDVGKWVSLGELPHERDKNGWLRFQSKHVDRFIIPTPAVRRERRRVALNAAGFMDIYEAGLYSGRLVRELKSAISSKKLACTHMLRGPAFKREDLDEWQRDYGSALNRPLEAPLLTMEAASQLFGIDGEREVWSLIHQNKIKTTNEFEMMLLDRNDVMWCLARRANKA